ncbi:hypothetical protein PC9H_002141 [Pleurotus ostreatus]|uniref:Major facilitator superfamily (MFS) profile domain-containing protein n=1 Tax=Pleurotus ostreatus TaxID=5322 RepID=A0A8H6ZPS9_PLEOS|nr:uncharacterized protein PC9H_002141 [Pleurotus ostreatus]KAF7419550.1 hypothetical protein PC9H_002141 [Pleurotus ostreatus]KAJ8689610.1 hypothetical protein PTI98_012498 [Pleurotus ostreatus]
MSSSFTTPSPSHRASLQTAFEDGKDEAFDPSPDIVMASAIDKTLEKDVEVASSQRDYTFVTFDKGTGEDPREWSSARKWFVTMAASFLCLAVALGSSIVTGDMEGPVEDLHTTQEIINLSVTCFVIGFGVGPLFFAPLSEVVGRTPMYCVSFFLYFIFTLPGPLAKNAATLIVSRQIAGIAASAPMCNVGGSIADVWSVEQRGIPMAVFSMTLFMGPCLGPMVGGWIGERAGWRWIYWVLFIFVGVCFAFSFFIPESLAHLLLRRKAEKLRKDTGDDTYVTEVELQRVPLSQTLKIALLRPLTMLVVEPVVIFMSIYLSFVYSLLYLLFFAFPIAFAEIRGFSAGLTGITFVSIMIGIGIALCLLPLQEKMYRKATVNGVHPEARLYLMMVGSILLPVALFIFAFTGAYAHVNFMGPCISGGVFGLAMILIYVSANSYIIDSYPHIAASALAAKTFMRSICGAMVPLFVNQMFHGLGFQYAGLLLALVSVAIIPIPFVFYKYGARIRAKSSYQM